MCRAQSSRPRATSDVGFVFLNNKIRKYGDQLQAVTNQCVGSKVPDIALDPSRKVKDPNASNFACPNLLPEGPLKPQPTWIAARTPGKEVFKAKAETERLLSGAQFLLAMRAASCQK